MTLPRGSNPSHSANSSSPFKFQRDDLHTALLNHPDSFIPGSAVSIPPWRIISLHSSPEGRFPCRPGGSSHFFHPRRGGFYTALADHPAYFIPGGAVSIPPCRIIAVRLSPQGRFPYHPVHLDAILHRMILPILREDLQTHA